MSAPKPLRGASWAAVSSLPQAKKVSLDDQLAANREHAGRHGVEIVAELVVPGESRNIVLFEDAARKMDAYARLHDLLKARAIDVLFFLDRSRLGRQASLSMAVVSLCVAYGVAVYEVENPPATIAAAARQSHDDMLIGAIKSVGAERDIRKLQERHRNGMIGRIKAGKPASKLVYGYRSVFGDDGTKSIVIDEPAAAIVARLFALYLDGHGTPSIARQFNAAGVPAPQGGRWQAINVRSILDNVRRYAGISEINRRSRTARPHVEGAGDWPPLIDADTLARIEAERSYRAGNRRRVETPYLLSGVVVCVHCGHRLRVRKFRKRQPHHLGSWQLVCVEHGGIAYRRVLAVLRDKMQSLQGADLDSLSVADVGDLAAMRDRLAAIAAQLDELAAAQARADSAYVRGSMTLDRYEAQVRRLEDDAAALRSEAARLQGAIAQEAARGTRRARLDDVAALGLAKLDDSDQAAANAWLRAHVRIYVDRRKVFAVEWL